MPTQLLTIRYNALKARPLRRTAAIIWCSGLQYALSIYNMAWPGAGRQRNLSTRYLLHIRLVPMLMLESCGASELDATFLS